MNSTRLSNVTVALPSGEGFGWGVCGSNLAKHLAEMGATIMNSPAVGVEPTIGTVLQAVASHEFGYTANIIGYHQIGYGFIENDIIAARYAPFAERLWENIISGSSWMENHLRATFRYRDMTFGTVIQGVDPEIFNYKQANISESFTVGSFGKFERRKSQDVVIRAMSLFRQRHKEVRLLHSWHNPWPQIVRDEYPQFSIEAISSGAAYSDMLVRAGLEGLCHGYSHRSYDAGTMATLYSMCDVALFPNRCEAGTNLCLMEALACGLPCIAANATGHRDLTGHPDYPCEDLNLDGGTTYVEKRGDIELGHWVAPCIDECLSMLEYAYRQRDELRRRRKEMAAFGGLFTWAKSAAKMASLLQ